MAIAVDMKHLIAVYVILWICAYPALSRTLYESSVAKTHQQWMFQYGRSYADEAEKEKRFKIFMQNLENIEKFNNAENKSYKLGLNQFSDLTEEEFIASHTGLKISTLPTSSSATLFNLSVSDIPTNLDWREQGAVTNIKNQGRCGCCWAFSTVAAVESIVQIQSKKLVSLSEQQLLDCNTQNYGCRGGYMDVAFNYIKNNGIATESEYSYKGVQGMCQSESVGTAQTISGYRDVAKNDEEQLLQTVAIQPVSVAISVNSYFQSYRAGIFEGPCGSQVSQLNHAVTIIGFGTTQDGSKYWLIKNSWGDTWGESGFMKLRRELPGQPQGVCGVAMNPSYPIINN